MVIDGKDPLAGLNPSVQRLDISQQQSPQPRDAGEKSTNSDLDRIELSVRSREIQHLDKLIESTPDVREARVEQIRSAVINGTYNVKAEKIAEKLIGGKIIDEVF